MRHPHTHVHIIRNGATTHVFLGGDFEATDATYLAAEFAPILDAPPTVVAINLRQVDFISPHAVAALSLLCEELDRISASWTILDVSTNARRAIEVAPDAGVLRAALGTM